MTTHPFNRPFSDQLASLEHGMDLLKAFAEAYPQLHPWALSPLMPSIYFGSHSIAEVGSVLGKSEWTVEQTLIHKEVLGVRCEVRLPIRAKSFEWEAGL